MSSQTVSLLNWRIYLRRSAFRCHFCSSVFQTVIEHILDFNILHFKTNDAFILEQILFLSPNLIELNSKMNWFYEINL